MRYTPTAVVVILFAMVSPAFCAKDAKEKEQHPTADYIEYRSLPELGQIEISSGFVRGPKAVARLHENADEFAKRGIFGCVDRGQPHVYRRSEKMGGHLIETTILIEPPAEKKPAHEKEKDGNADEPEPDWTRHVVVRVDGHKKFDCSLGDAPAAEITVYGLTLYPEDGTVDAAASDFDGVELTLPDEALKIDSRGVITDDSFEEADPGDDSPDDGNKPKAIPVVTPPNDASNSPRGIGHV